MPKSSRVVHLSEVTGARLEGRTRLVELTADGLPVCEPGQTGVIVTGRWDVTGAHIEVAALWVYVDPASGRPARLTPAFHEAYDEAAGGRTVQARLRHGPPPAPDGEPGSEVESRPWPLRSTDIDRLAHVNNAATWAAVEDELDRRGLVAGAAELEYPDAIAPRSSAELRVALGEAGTLALWLLVADKVVASARVEGRPA